MRRKSSLALAAGLILVLTAGLAFAAPKAEPWSRWEANDPNSTVRVDHAPWGRFLKQYVVTGGPSGANLVKYDGVTDADRKSLDNYISMLTQVKVSSLNRAEQEAYWINLYNSLTLQVVLDRYPVDSILDINISPGLFSRGPWEKKLVEIEGEKVSLDDIEHRILRPIWKDNRIHYAVNCASIGCPNLARKPYTASEMDRMLDQGARDYINSPRGVKVEDGNLTLSKIYSWYQVDFGGSEKGVIAHILKYAGEPLIKKLQDYSGDIEYEYNWDLNDARSGEKDAKKRKGN